MCHNLKMNQHFITYNTFKYSCKITRAESADET